MLALMHREAMKRHAPVFSAESATKSTPFTILAFTMLSARTKDDRVPLGHKRLPRTKPWHRESRENRLRSHPL